MPTKDEAIEILHTEEEERIKNLITPRLWKKYPWSAPRLVLEIIDGPYKGVIYEYSKFTVLEESVPAPDGMVPTRFETKIIKAPDDFIVDEAFDEFTRDILIPWLAHLTAADYTPLLRAKTEGVH